VMTMMMSIDVWILFKPSSFRLPLKSQSILK
jgi:hypothetical protein